MLFLTISVFLTGIGTTCGSAVASVSIKKPYNQDFYQLSLDIDSVSNIQPIVPDDEVRAVELTVISVSSENEQQTIDIRLVRCNTEIFATEMRASSSQVFRFEKPWVPLILNGTGYECAFEDPRNLEIFVHSRDECQLTFAIEKVMSEQSVANFGFPTQVQFDLPPARSRKTVPLDGLFKFIEKTDTNNSVIVSYDVPVQFKIGVCGSDFLTIDCSGVAPRTFTDIERRAISLMRHVKCRTWEEDLTSFYVETVSGKGVVTIGRNRDVPTPKLLELGYNLLKDTVSL